MEKSDLDATRVALLIDSENISHKYAETICGNASASGRVIVRRVYSGYYDDDDEHKHRWPKQTLIDHNIKPKVRVIHSPKKNACDMELAIDALRLAHQKMVDVVYIVSNDSDFTPLAEELKELGIIVYGCGEKGKAQTAFVESCDKFEYLSPQQQSDVIQPISGLAQIEKEIENESDVIQTMIEACKKFQDEEGWTKVGRVGTHVRRVFPAFTPENYNYTKFSDMIKAHNDKLEYNNEEPTIPKIRVKK